VSDNPFSEPDDSERTVLRPRAGGAAQQPPAASPFSTPTHTQTGMQPGMQTVSVPRTTAPRPAVAPLRLASEADALPHVGKSPMAAAAAPLLELLAILGLGAHGGSAGNAEDVRDRAVRALQTFEADCRAARVSDEQLRAGHYALCAALDDTALSTPWAQNSSWAARSLSSTFHQDARSGDRFFDMLAGMQQEPGRYLPALEICYLCLALGLRGRYRLDPRGSAELDRIREGLYQVLSKQHGAIDRELAPHWKGVDAPHRGPARDVPPWVFAAVALAVLALGYVFISSWANSKGDELQDRVGQLQPKAPPTIQREAVVVAPAAVAPASPDLAARVRKFLEPEINEGLVEVQGDAQRLMVRVMARGMFESGSPEIEPKFVLLLKRVGEALRNEPGPVLVLGHSDNQPIRTVRFPSNFQLSAARADSARAVLAAATAQPDRYTSAGRADTEPLVPNDSAANRERNRRIEIVLTRSEAR
jgi:type VI secretion system protein ImpK